MTLPIAPAEPAVEAWIAPWCLETDLPTDRLADVPDSDIGRMIGAATDILYCFSGRQFRTGRSRIRPSSINSSYGTQSYLYPYSSMSGYGAAWGFAAGWSWTAVGMGWWQNGQDLSEILLNGPVTRINEVWVDGVLLDPSQYTLYDGRRLVRNLDPSGQSSSAWPWNQNLQIPITYPGTALIDYEWGRPPPDSGWLACVELATELALAVGGSDRSTLANRVVSMASEGISVQVGDSLSYIREQLTSLPLCDLFIQAYNPQKLRRRSVFLAPNSTVGRSLPYGQ